jgi:hypothetical protein
MSSNVGSANDSFAASGSSPQIEPDFFAENHGSIFLLRPVTPAGFAWVSEHIPEDAQFFGEAVCVEHRYIADIVEGIRECSLEVR